MPATSHRPRSGGRRRLADARHGVAVARLRTAAADRSPAVSCCDARQSLRRPQASNTPRTDLSNLPRSRPVSFLVTVLA